MQLSSVVLNNEVTSDVSHLAHNTFFNNLIGLFLLLTCSYCLGVGLHEVVYALQKLSSKLVKKK